MKDFFDFRLRFDQGEVAHWAHQYVVQAKRKDMEIEREIEEEIAPRVRSRGYFTKSEFITLCRWKTPRSQSRCAANSAELIAEVTRTALASEFEEMRIGVLLLLRGVSWPTASVLLHFGSTDPYPILDFRALWSLGIDPSPTNSFAFWVAYTKYCRNLTYGRGLSMRCLDRALWQYSAVNQQP